MSMNGDKLRLSVEDSAEAEGVAVLAVGGEVDLANADDLAIALQAPDVAGATAIVLDLSDVTFLDSSGLRVVLLAAKEHGERFATVVADESAVARLFSLVEVSERLNVARSRSEALEALPSGAPDEAG